MEMDNTTPPKKLPIKAEKYFCVSCMSSTWHTVSDDNIYTCQECGHSFNREVVATPVAIDHRPVYGAYNS